VQPTPRTSGGGEMDKGGDGFRLGDWAGVLSSILGAVMLLFLSLCVYVWNGTTNATTARLDKAFVCCEKNTEESVELRKNVTVKIAEMLIASARIEEQLKYLSTQMQHMSTLDKHLGRAIEDISAARRYNGPSIAATPADAGNGS